MADGSAAWQIDRRISLGHIVTTATFLLAMVVWGSRLETRIALMEDTQARQAVVDDRQDLDARRTREEIRDELRRLNEKIDRYYEKRWKGPEDKTPAAGRA